jgi:hypothetical protein
MHIVTNRLFGNLPAAGQRIIIIISQSRPGHHGESQFDQADLMVATSDDPQDQALRAELARLQQEHRDLDVAIAALQSSPGADILQLKRLKKRKLQLRDRIVFVEDQITPDIIA